MQKKWFIFLMTSLLIILSACDDKEWYEADEETTEEVEEFIISFREAWGDSLSTQSFRPVEEFLYPNSQFFHMKRRNHQQYASQRIVEETVSLEVASVEASDDGEVRAKVEEKIEQTGGQIGEEERIRTYYLLPFRDTYRVVSMERHDN